MKTFLTIAVLLAALVVTFGLVCLSMVLPGAFALSPWVAGCFVGWCIGETLGEIWAPEPLEIV